MRKLSGSTGVIVFASVLALGFAGVASARTLTFSGTFEIDVGAFYESTGGTGTGVATVTTTGVSGGHLQTLTLGGTAAMTPTGTVAQTNPENATLVSLRIDKTVAGRKGVPLGKGILGPISGGGPLTQNTLTNTGIAPPRFKQCILFAGCNSYLPVPVTKNGTQGAGIGGTVTVNTFSKGSGLHLSVMGVPWTLGLGANAAKVTGIPNRLTLTPNGGVTNTYALEMTSITANGGTTKVPGFCKGSGGAIDGHAKAGQPRPHLVASITTITPNGGVNGPTPAQCVRVTVSETRTRQGTIHGPASATSSTASLSGVIQVVVPGEISTSLTPPSNFLPYFGRVTLHFVPEPGMALLLGSGIAGLVLVGRRRARR